MRRELITNRARAMRKTMSDAEVILWSRLRGRGPDKPTFRRQHPFGTIILDFYCPAARLDVEVDGATHWDDEAQRRDEARDHWLGSVVDGVLLRAEALIEVERQRMRLAPSTPRSSLRSAGGPPPAASRGR